MDHSKNGDEYLWIEAGWTALKFIGDDCHPAK